MEEKIFTEEELEKYDGQNGNTWQLTESCTT
jgi:predicted heme/steroid binding protein